MIRAGRTRGALFARGALLALLIAAPAVAQRKGVPTPPPLSGADEVYRMGRDALARGSFDAAARLFRALEGEPAIAETPGYAFNRAQAARFLAEAGEAVFWYGRYLALAPQAADAATVRDLAAKLAATQPKSVRQEALRRARLEWARASENAELSRALAACPRVRLSVRFAKEGIVLGGAAFTFSGRAVFWEPGEGEAPGTMWVALTEPAAPPDELGGPALLLLPAGRALAVPVGPDLVSPPVTLGLPGVAGVPADPGLAAWRVEVTARVVKEGPPLLLVARRTPDALAEVRSAPDEATILLGKKRRDAPSETLTLLYGPRPARDAKGMPHGLQAVVALPAKEGTLETWAAPFSLFDVANRFARETSDASGTRVWVRAEAQGPFLPTLGK